MPIGYLEALLEGKIDMKSNLYHICLNTGAGSFSTLDYIIFHIVRCRAFWAYLRIIFAAIYISWKGVPKSSDENSNRYRPDIIICDQISACIPFIKNRESLSWLFPNAPKVGK